MAAVDVFLICLTILSRAEVEFFRKIKMIFIEINLDELRERERARERERENDKYVLNELMREMRIAVVFS